MKLASYKYFLCLLTLAAQGCEAPSTNSNSTAVSAVAVPTPTDVSPKKARLDYEVKYSDEILSEAEALFCRDYKIEKHQKPLIIGGKKFEDGHNYAILKKNGKTVARFDGVYHPAGTEIRFGLISLFGQSAGQMIIEQTAHRDWRY